MTETVPELDKNRKIYQLEEIKKQMANEIKLVGDTLKPIKSLGIKIKDIQANSESDVEHKVIVPFLEKIKGYTSKNGVEKRFRKAKVVPVGGRLEKIIPDIAIYVDSEPFLMVDSKPINRTIEIGDVNESISNARLYELPKQFPFSIVSTGLNWEIYDTLSGVYLGDHDSIPDINRAKVILQKGVRTVPDTKAEEAQRILEAKSLIKDRHKLYSVFKECKTRIEAEGKHGHEALAEISKIILAKIYEEQYHVEDQRTYRFSIDFIDGEKRDHPGKDETDIINDIFREANKRYQGKRPTSIFPTNSSITLSYGTVRKIVELLEKPAFYNGGEDIKGAVYETFLKTLFRGEFGQYFTPREIVRFMVQLVDPKPGEKILDPACGSGGFLINSFISVRKKILGLKGSGIISDEEAQAMTNRLLEKDLWGVDVAETLVQFCKINLIIQRDGYQNIYREDALNKNRPLLKNDEFDVILTNPPFDLPTEHLEHVVGDYVLYTQYGYDGADVLYMERCYELLKPSGRLAIVVPHRFIDGKEFENLRQWLLERMIIRAVVNLPVGVFMPFGGSNARTSILYLYKPRSMKLEKKGHSLMATAKYVGFEPGVQEYRPHPDKNDLENIATSQHFFKLKAEEREYHVIR
jgi:type I restriction enzyme M protein